MKYAITVVPSYLKVEITYRHTAEETLECLTAVRTELAKHHVRKVLISLKSSVALFKLEAFHLSEFLEYARAIGAQIALAGDSDALLLSHEYVELVAIQKGVNLRAFDSERRAIEWLMQEAAISITV